MKTPIIFIAAFFATTPFCKAQVPKPDSSVIVLSGYLDSAALRKPIDTIEVQYFKDYDYQLFQRPIIYKAPLINQRFEIRIRSDQFGYLMIPAIRMFSFYANLHLVNAGDSLELQGTGKNQFLFSGNAADRMNDQLRTGRALYLNDRKNFADISDTERISYQKKRESALIRNYSDSLDRHGQGIPENEREMLNILSSYSIKGMCLFEMTVFMDSASTKYQHQLKEEISRRLTLELSLPESEKQYNSKCFTYLFYLTDLNKAAISLENKNSNFSFETGYEFINRHYLGLLRDKLLVQYFGLRKTDAGMLDVLPKAIALVKDPMSKQLLMQIADARLPGSQVFPFSFQDTTGKTIALSDLRGKVVLMDSWYKGCINCAILKKQLEAVISHFRNNVNVVFLGLNVDTDKKRFIEGIKSGLYTAPETLNLFTNGLGPEHPMLTHYQYNGYPNLLLIDKRGKLISANPPRPATPEKTKALIDLIEEHL